MKWFMLLASLAGFAPQENKDPLPEFRKGMAWEYEGRWTYGKKLLEKATLRIEVGERETIKVGGKEVSAWRVTRTLGGRDDAKYWIESDGAKLAIYAREGDAFKEKARTELPKKDASAAAHLAAHALDVVLRDARALAADHKFCESATELVKVPAGEYKALKAAWNGEVEIRPHLCRSVLWFAPGTGLVRAEVTMAPEPESESEPCGYILELKALSAP